VCYLARSFARSIRRYLSMRYIYEYMQRRSLASEIAIVQHKAIMMFLKVNFHIRTLHRNISVRRARRGKMKTFLLYNSDPNYQLRLFRIRSVQSLLRFDNHECMQLAGSHLNTRSDLATLYIWYKLVTRYYCVSW